MSPATFLVPLGMALAGSLVIEAAASRRPSLRPGDLAIRAAGYTLITLFWFQFSWRPWLAATSCLLTLAVLAVVDRLKRKVIGEPVVFSDLALLAQVPRHPQLYYTLPLTDLRIAGPLFLGLSAIVAWYVLEPAALPEASAPRLLAILGLPAALAGLVFAALTPPAERWLRRVFPRPDLAEDVARYGLVATMMGYALRRLGESRTRPVAPTPPVGAPAGPADEVVVVVQLESFLDPARIGGPDLPLMARIRAQAAQYGRLAVPAHGAYTMRSEHAVLTGCEPETLGFGRFDPYLARKGDEPTSLARLARAAGFRTIFVHPFDRDFFDRARVFARLGFDRLVMEEDFARSPRVGPYVGDVAVAERILAEVAEGSGRTFLFSVTMENHGPWKAGRLTGIDAPLAQYVHHVANTGRAVELLIDGLAHRRATLCVFGDHAPSLPGLRLPAEGPLATDYALFRFGRNAAPSPARIDLTAARLGCVLRDALSGKTEGLRG